MTESSLRSALQASPLLFPLDMNEQSVQLIALQEVEYESASFLDRRMIAEDRKFAVIPWDEFQLATRGLNPRCDFIFHISHTGSTLLSRLLGSHRRLFSLREPLILRRLVQKEFANRGEGVLRILSRTYRPHQRALVKATSVVSEIGAELMAASPGSRSILMYIQPESFLCALLGGAMTDIASAAAGRLSRLQSRGMLPGMRLADLSPAECVAMSWLSEMVALAEIADSFPNATLWLDFDHFLEDPAGQLSKVCCHLNVEDYSAAMANSSLLHRYAKKTEVAYDRAFRSRLLNDTKQRYSSEISAGLRWIERHAKSFQCALVSI